MYAFRFDALPKAGLPGIHHTTLACTDNGAQHLSVWRQRIEAGHATPPHKHTCEEVVTVLSGRGQLLIADQVIEFGRDDTLVLPPDVDHQLLNNGDEVLELIAAFAATPVVTLSCEGETMQLPWRT